MDKELRKSDFRNNRYMAQRYFIYGVPGVGKTYFSKKLREKTELPHIELDSIKEQNQPGTCQAYARFGELNEENAVRGLKFVRDLYRNKIKEVIDIKQGGIFDAAFIDPNSVKSLGAVILIIALDEKLHREHFFVNRENTLDTIHEFQVARLVQEYLIQEAKDLGIKIVESFEGFEKIWT